MKKRILIVDDERNVRMMYRAALETEGFDIAEADSGAAALEQFGGEKFDVAVLDLRMPEMDGLELLEVMRDKNITTPAVIITAYGDVPNAVKAMKLGAIDFLPKPVTPDQLRTLLDEVIERHAAPPPHARKGSAPKYKAEPNIHLLAAKRAINNREFDVARKHLAEVIKQNDRMIEAHNLLGVLFEMQHEYSIARRCYGRAISIDSQYEPAQQNMRRLFELFQFGSSKEPINLGPT
ncbi:MAG: response regulator [Chthoniobacterales bacterium]